MVTRVLGPQMPRTMELVDEARAVLVDLILVLIVRLDEPPVQIADIWGEDGESGPQVVIVLVENSSHEREDIPVQLGVAPVQCCRSRRANLLDNPDAVELCSSDVVPRF